MQGADSVPDVVTAKKFVLVNEAGETRATLGVNADGDCGLTLCDAAGKTRASLVITSDGTPGLIMFDRPHRQAPACPVGNPTTVLSTTADKAGTSPHQYSLKLCQMLPIKSIHRCPFC
jgi:hypothetical protein